MLLSDEAFNVETHATFVYTVDTVRSGDGGYVISGMLTANGRTQPLEVRATVTVNAERLNVAAVAEVDRSEWGMDWTKMGAGLINKVAVTAVFIRD